MNVTGIQSLLWILKYKVFYVLQLQTLFQDYAAEEGAQKSYDQL